jgi:hypothetical protein
VEEIKGVDSRIVSKGRMIKKEILGQVSKVKMKISK